MELIPGDFNRLALCVEGFFFGIYSGIFAIFLRYNASKKVNDRGRTIVFYALCVLYALSLVTIIVDTTIISGVLYHLVIVQTMVFGCCDFIAQSILIYRCYIMWGNNIRIIIIPSILAFTFLVIWITEGTAPVKTTVEYQVIFSLWAETLVTTSLAMSLIVNALVTALIVFRIVKSFRDVNSTGTTQSRSTPQRVIGIIIESGMTLFAIQLARLVISILLMFMDDRVYSAFIFSVFIHQMINGITPTIIVVRVSMGLSFAGDENFMAEVSGTESLLFAPAAANSIPETENIGKVDQELRNPDIEIQTIVDIHGPA